MNDSKNEASARSHEAPAPLVPASRGVPALADPQAQPGPYGSDSAGATDGLGPDLLEYWRILRKRGWLILSIAGAILILGLVGTLMMTPVYTSTVRLQIDRNVAKIVEGGSVNPIEGADLEFFKTQYELLQSRALAERIVSALRLGDDADFLTPAGFSIAGAVMGAFGVMSPAAQDKKDLQQLAATIVLANRGVKPVAGSRLVDLSYTDPAPARAQRIATAFADAFIAANLDKRFQANAYAKTFLEDQLRQLKLRLEDSEKTLLDFSEKEQIIVVTEKASIAENNLASANAALGNLVSERIKAEQLWKQIESATGITLPQLLTNSVIDGLRGKRNALVTEYEEKLETFKPGYPAMVQISNKIAEIDRQLAVEVRTIRESYKASYESSASQEAEMKKRIETLRAEVLDLQRRSIQYNILKREVDTNRSLYESLLQRYKEVDVAAGVGANNVFIVDRAQLPSSPSSPRLLRAIALCLILGLGAGVGAAYVIERLDDRLSSVEEVERLTGLPTLGVIPKISADKDIDAEFADPRSALSEACRSLCTALQFSTERGLPKSLLFTSSASSEGKSMTSLATARYFATLGLKVLLIDADLRKASLHEKLGLDNGVGLSNYLTGGCAAPDAFQATDTPDLTFMASGPLPPNAADLLNGSRLRSLISFGLEVFDLIVIDGPPVMGLADVQLLSSVVTATVFVVGAGQARVGAVRGALRRLQLAKSPVIGSALNKFDARSASYGYGYGYGYGYDYGQERPAIGSAGRKGFLARDPERV